MALSTLGNVARPAIRVSTGVAPAVTLLQDRENVGNFNVITGWTAFGDDTDNLAVSTKHILGTNSIEFDKVDGLDNTKIAGAGCTITSVDVSRFMPSDVIMSAVYVSNKANVDYALIRLGTDSSNYNEWRLADTAITDAVWSPFAQSLDSCQVTVVGTGWDSSAVTYIAVGVAFAAEGNALADLKFDHVHVVGGLIAA